MPCRRNSGRGRWPVIALAAAAIAGFLAWSVWPSRGVPLANPDDSRQVALGRAIYQDRCASCHGADLRGQPDWQTRKPDGRMPAPPHDASGHTWHHPDDQLFGIVKHGIEPFASPGYQSDMPSFEGALADEEIWAVIAFLKSAWPERERSFQERVSRPMRGAEE